MPTDSELREHQATHKVRIWGISRPGTDPCRLGEIAVVPFYDHVDAIRAAERQVWTERSATGLYALVRADERKRIRAAVIDYYKVAPKAAEPILRIIDGAMAYAAVYVDEIQLVEAFNNGVDKAREAVANCPSVKWYPNGLVQKDVLAAIDGLRAQS